MILSFDVEEHYRIEAAVGLQIDQRFKAACRNRVDSMVHWLLDLLESRDVKATFFVLGCIAQSNAELVRRIHRSGHEVGSHGWDHRSLLRMSPSEFREDLHRSRTSIEDAIGVAIAGYRAPTFSITRRTAWALDILAESGMRYDSSIFPVRHDRYGIPDAPREPFVVLGTSHEIIVLPPATVKIARVNVPLGGGRSATAD
mgnify:CR=1 FL=1